jgi:hypothetical protein
MRLRWLGRSTVPQVARRFSAICACNATYQMIATRCLTNPQILRPWLHLRFNPVGDADECRFINVALDDIATTIAGAQHTLGPLGIVVRRRLQFQEEHPISDFEIEMDGVVIAIKCRRALRVDPEEFQKQDRRDIARPKIAACA